MFLSLPFLKSPLAAAFSSLPSLPNHTPKITSAITNTNPAQPHHSKLFNKIRDLNPCVSCRMRGTGPVASNMYQHNYSHQTNSGYSSSTEKRILKQRLIEERAGFAGQLGERFPGHPTGGPPEFTSPQQARRMHSAITLPVMIVVIFLS